MLPSLLRGSSRLSTSSSSSILRSLPPRPLVSFRSFHPIPPPTKLIRPSPSSPSLLLTSSKRFNTTVSSPPPPATTNSALLQESSVLPTSPLVEVLVKEPAPPRTWVEDMPKSVRPYLYLIRIDKPIGTWLLFWPCAWGILLSSTVNSLPLSTPIFYSALFGLGALIMRGAGCIINDMWDIKIDKAVERTKLRPLAAGDVTLKQATAFLGLNLTLGLGVLTQLNPYSIVLGASSLSLVAIYPAMKRVTHWPQLVLGFAFNWGVLLGWSATAGYVDWAIALPLYMGGVLHMIVCDTIYAHQDKLDDALAGVKSTALLFAHQTKPILSLFSVTIVSLLAYTGYLASCSPAYYVISVAGTAAHLGWQLKSVDLDVRSSCWRVFKSNKWLGGLISLGLGVDYWWRVGGGREMVGVEKREEGEERK
ncbi:UbiA prenyltransferase family-domain-containing protein [Mrakia frigida]|uniref:4-hydroxybenzoate octaprenyltransferase n=1 Tax=Mrakia frigida TaxID=29902 RepID=UPI003FCC2445